MKHKLPLISERALANTKAHQVQASLDFDRKLPASGVTCTKGCSNCCHMPLSVTVLEGLLLYRWLSEQGRWTSALRKRISEVRDKTLGLSTHVWLLSNIPCPLLEDNRCLGYESRPFKCRVTYSVGPSSSCHPHARLSPQATSNEVPNEVALKDFDEKVRFLLKPLGTASTRMPISEALLLGEKLASGTLELEDVGLQHAKDLLHV